MARDRFDGADVVHLLRACSEQLDWSRLLQRFGSQWRVLLATDLFQSDDEEEKEE